MRILVALLAALGAAGAVGASGPAPAAGSRANVVVIMTDDQTYADMAAMPLTRGLIGAAGATFTRAYVSYPLCCPSRATYLTGQYAHNHGVRSTVPPDGGVEALDAEHTLPVWLRAEGYDTIHIGKYLAYEASTHVPLLVRGPGIPAGTVSGELVANTDLAPTVLAATGASADLPQDGRSLLPYARDGTLRSERPILHEGLVGGADRDDEAATGRVRVYYAIRTRRYLYVKWHGGPRELYDLRRDPFELRSRHDDPRYAAVAEQLSLEVKRLRHCVGEECDAPVPTQPPTRRAGEVPSTAPPASRARTTT